MLMLKHMESTSTMTSGTGDDLFWILRFSWSAMDTRFSCSNGFHDNSIYRMGGAILVILVLLTIVVMLGEQES